MKKKILVLGETSALGAQVITQLRISGVALYPEQGKDIDVLDLSALRATLREAAPDAIINCAAHVGGVHYVTKFAGDVIRDNLTLILNMYEAVRLECPDAMVINPLSNCSYPGDADIQRESEWQDGPVHDTVLAYGSAKRMEYVVAECYRKQWQIKTINWLIANHYGPGDHTDPTKVHALAGIIIRLIQAQRKGDTEFSIWGTGLPQREWAYIEDIARILALSVSGKEQVYPMNFAQNKGYSITDIARIAAQVLKYDVTFTYDTSKPDGAPIKILDDTLFREHYPDFQFTPLADGIKNTIEYYEKTL